MGRWKVGIPLVNQNHIAFCFSKILIQSSRLSIIDQTDVEHCSARIFCEVFDFLYRWGVGRDGKALGQGGAAGGAWGRDQETKVRQTFHQCTPVLQSHRGFALKDKSVS